MDIICHSETNTDSSVRIGDDNFEIPGYRSVRNDHLLNTKCGRILIYFKYFLRIILIDVKFLHESLNFELRV